MAKRDILQVQKLEFFVRGGTNGKFYVIDSATDESVAMLEDEQLAHLFANSPQLLEGVRKLNFYSNELRSRADAALKLRNKGNMARYDLAVTDIYTERNRVSEYLPEVEYRIEQSAPELDD